MLWKSTAFVLSTTKGICRAGEQGSDEAQSRLDNELDEDFLACEQPSDSMVQPTTSKSIESDDNGLEEARC